MVECNANEVKVVKCEYNFGNNNILLATGTIDKTLNANRKNNDLQYKYHIEDINNFNEVEDYVEITNKDGKNITFSLKCK